MTEDSIPQSRVCFSCGKEYPLTAEYFHKDKNKRWGFTHRCKSCAIEKTRAWERADPERAKQSDHNSYKKHQAKRNAQSRQWAEANPDKRREIWRRSSESNIERKRESGREWARNHPERRVNWREANPEKYGASNKRNHAKRKARLRLAEGSFTQSDLLRLYADQDGRCAYCGITLSWQVPRDIHIDHVQALTRGGSNNPDNLLLTCSHCNLSKGNKAYSEWLPVRGW